MTKIEVRNASTGVFETVWSGTDTTAQGSLGDLVVSFTQRSYLVDAVRVTVNTTESTGWEEIDAVQLSGSLTDPPGGVNQGPTTTLVTASANPSVIGQSVTFTATVTASAHGSETPTGAITFSDRSTILGTVSLSSGVATLNIASLAVGSHAITASYEGDADFTASSGSLTQTVSQTSRALIGQWANSVIAFSSQYSATYWSAAQAIGAPNVTAYGDYPQASAPVPRTAPPSTLP